MDKNLHRPIPLVALGMGLTVCLGAVSLPAQDTGKKAPKLSEIQPVESDSSAKREASSKSAEQAKPDTAAEAPAPKAMAPALKASPPTVPEPKAPGSAFDTAVGKVAGIEEITGLGVVNSLLLEQLQSGQISAEKAWQSGLLDGKMALELLSRLELFPIKWRPLVDELAGLVAGKSPELIVNVEKLHPRAKAHFAAYFLSVSDPRTPEFYESMIAAIPSPPTPEPAMPVFKLSDYYSKIGDFRKAAETRLRMKDYTTSPASLANSEVEAARFYRLIGEEEKAQKLLEGASRHGYGWATGLAICDQATFLLNNGIHEEARKLLKTNVEGLYADQINIVSLSMLSYSYYQTGEWEQSQYHAQKCLDIAKNIGSRLLKGEGIEGFINLAGEIMVWSKKWQDEPITVSERLSLIVGKGKEVELPFTVQTGNLAPLTVKVNDGRIRARMSGKSQNHYLYHAQEALIEITSETIDSDVDALVTITNAQNPNYSVQVPIHIKVKDAINTSEKSLFFGRVTASNPTSKSVDFSSQDKFRIISIESNDESLQSDFDSLKESSHHVLNFKYILDKDDLQKRQIREGTIKIITNVREQEEIAIPYIVQIE